jgi:DNA-binding NtrC family response regulator
MVFRARPTVMIAEDNPLIVESYEDAVTDAGLSVAGSFLSCKSAEDWLSVHAPDVAILDIALQDGNSAELAKSCAAGKFHFSSSPVIRPNRTGSMIFSNRRRGWKSQSQPPHWRRHCAT